MVDKIEFERGAPVSEESDAFVSGFHGIPSPDKLSRMSFVELAELLSSCKKDSPKFIVVEREMRNRLAKDQAKINLPNMLWAAALGGVFAIVGAAVGAFIRGLPPASQAVPAQAQTSQPPAGNKSPVHVPSKDAEATKGKP